MTRMYLLDSHVILWLLTDDARLKAPLRATLVQAAPQVFVSAASIWELSIKHALGKLPIPDDLVQATLASGLTPLPITLAHALAAGALPPHHRDPFDRMLIAQTQAGGPTLVTHDARMRPYDVKVLWAKERSVPMPDGLTRRILDRWVARSPHGGGCTLPGCGCAPRRGMYLFQTCHPARGFRLHALASGTLLVQCGGCPAVAAQIRGWEQAQARLDAIERAHQASEQWRQGVERAVVGVEPQPQDELETLWFSNPREAARRLTEQVTSQAEARYNARESSNAFWGTFEGEYPELAPQRKLVQYLLATEPGLGQLPNSPDGRAQLAKAAREWSLSVMQGARASGTVPPRQPVPPVETGTRRRSAPAPRQEPPQP